jgi:chromate reductase, NAD(P)H dehydrogenase (quinone)
MKVLGISGSLRRESLNRRLLVEVAELFPPGTELELFESLKAVPPYDEDEDDGAAEAVDELREAIAGADAVLFATPEYNSSIPGQLKNGVDWASRPAGGGVLFGKPVAVAGASTGAFGAVWAQADLRKVLARAGARVVEAELAIGHADRRLAEHGEVLDADLRAQAAELVQALLAETGARVPAAA